MQSASNHDHLTSKTLIQNSEAELMTIAEVKRQPCINKYFLRTIMDTEESLTIACNDNYNLQNSIL